MKRKLYIDFDGTLYNTDKLTKNFIELCQKYDLTEEEKNKLVEQFSAINIFLDMDEFIKSIQNEYKLADTILKDIEKLYSLSYIYKDVESSLQKLKESNKYEMYILTYGSVFHQQKKIQASKIGKYFKDIIIVTKNKATLKEVDYKNGIFIDNNPLEIAGFLNAKAKNVIRIRRPSDKYSSQDSKSLIKEYTSFQELVEKELL